MSVELNVYCYGDSLAPIADLQEMLEVAGWEIRVVESAEGLEPFEGDTVGSGLVIGWEAGAEHADAAEKAVRNRDVQAVEALFKKNRLAAVSVDLDTDHSPDPEDLEFFEDAEVEPKYIEAVRSARFVYCVRTSASRNKASLEFQELVWNAIAIAAYGLAYDPEDGSFEDNAREVLEAADREASEEPAS